MVLRGHREHQEAERDDLRVPIMDDGLVFARVDGSPFYPSAASHAFLSIARKAGLDEGIHLHSLRHTHASCLLLAQGDIGPGGKPRRDLVKAGPREAFDHQ